MILLYLNYVTKLTKKVDFANATKHHFFDFLRWITPDI